ncbi:MAG TPA: dipeptidase PepE [Actinocrinis sp.]
MNDLMLLSNSFSPGLGALEHAMDALARLFAGCRDVLFVPYAGSNPDAYTDAMSEILATLDLRVTGAHRTDDPLGALASSDAVFVGGGNAFRLLRAVQRNGLLPAIRERAAAGMPYLGVSAGANLACPTIRTTNDMPIVQPENLQALGLIPFQVNPHYPDAQRDGEAAGRARDQRLREFLEENDVPVLGLCEGSWLEVRDGTRAGLGGTAGGRLFTRGREPIEVRPGDDLSNLLHIRPGYDAPAS